MINKINVFWSGFKNGLFRAIPDSDIRSFFKFCNLVSNSGDGRFKNDYLMTEQKLFFNRV